MTVGKETPRRRLGLTRPRALVSRGHRGDKEGGRSLGKCGGLAAPGRCQDSASSLAADLLRFPSPDLCLSFPICQMPPIMGFVWEKNTAYAALGVSFGVTAGDTELSGSDGGGCRGFSTFLPRNSKDLKSREGHWAGWHCP